MTDQDHRLICEIDNCQDFAYYHYFVSYGHRPMHFEHNGKQFHNYCKKHNEQWEKKQECVIQWLT